MPYSVNHTTMYLEAADESATVRVDAGGLITVRQQRWVSLDVGSNELAVSVTAADGTLQEYTVTVERAAARIDATLASLSATGVDFGTFDSATTSYQASADHATTAVTVTAAPSDSVAAVTITPADADRAAPGHQVELPVGVTAVQTTVTAQDGITQRIYTVSVTRAAAGATLNALGTDGADIGTFASDRFSYSASVPHGTAVVTLRPTTSSSSAVITYSSVDSDPVASGHQVALAEGRNRFTITVTDGLVQRRVHAGDLAGRGGTGARQYFGVRHQIRARQAGERIAVCERAGQLEHAGDSQRGHQQP